MVASRKLESQISLKAAYTNYCKGLKNTYPLPRGQKIDIYFLGLKHRDHFSLHSRICHCAFMAILLIKKWVFRQDVQCYENTYLRERIFQHLEICFPRLDHPLFTSARKDLLCQGIQNDQKFKEYSSELCEQCIEIVEWLNNEVDHSKTFERLKGERVGRVPLDTKEKISAVTEKLKNYQGSPKEGFPTGPIKDLDRPKGPWISLNQSILDYREQLFEEQCSLDILFQKKPHESDSLQMKWGTLSLKLLSLCEALQQSAEGSS